MIKPDKTKLEYIYANAQERNNHIMYMGLVEDMICTKIYKDEEGLKASFERK